MKKENRIKDLKKMYDSMTNPVEIDKARREAEKKERLENEKKDTGL